MRTTALESSDFLGAAVHVISLTTSDVAQHAKEAVRAKIWSRNLELFVSEPRLLSSPPYTPLSLLHIALPHANSNRDNVQQACV